MAALATGTISIPIASPFDICAFVAASLIEPTSSGPSAGPKRPEPIRTRLASLRGGDAPPWLDGEAGRRPWRLPGHSFSSKNALQIRE